MNLIVSILSKIKNLLFGKPEVKKSTSSAKKTVRKSAEKRKPAKKRPAGKNALPPQKPLSGEKKSGRSGEKNKKEKRPRSILARTLEWVAISFSNA